MRDMDRKDDLRIDQIKKLNDYTAEMLVSDAMNIAKQITELKTAQIRRLFGEVKRMQMDFERGSFSRDRVVLLKPKLAYAVSRKREIEPLKRALETCINKISTDREQGLKDFETFVNFFEAVLAYHKG